MLWPALFATTRRRTVSVLPDFFSVNAILVFVTALVPLEVVIIVEILPLHAPVPSVHVPEHF